MSNHSWPHTIRIIVFACLLGGAAGVIGTALTASSLSEYSLELSELTEPLRLTQERPRALPKDYGDMLSRIEDQSLPAVGSLFNKSMMDSWGTSIFDADATAIALTSDGWSLSTQGTIGDVISWEQQTCEVDEVVNEPMFGFSFVHCAISNIPVVDVTAGFDVHAGDQLFVASIGYQLIATEVQSVIWGDTLLYGDEPTRRIITTDTSLLTKGSAVFNMYGELIGVVDENGRVIPFEFLSGAFEQVLGSKDVITYPSLGVNGIDLTRSVEVPENISNGLRSGFVIYGASAVERKSPAFNAGLLAGDIIISVDGITVNGMYSLGDIFAIYSVGDNVSIEFERNGNTQEIIVALGEMKF